MIHKAPGTRALNYADCPVFKYRFQSNKTEARLVSAEGKKRFKNCPLFRKAYNLHSNPWA
jgi:hypothetical protein